MHFYWQDKHSLLLGSQTTKSLLETLVLKSLTNLEEILIKQRKILEEGGLLVVLLIATWKDKKLQLKSIRIETLAISSTLDIPKLESKIKNWWVSKLTTNINKNDPLKIIKKIIERRLNGLVNSYLSLEYEIELEETSVLLFINKD